MTFTPEQVEEVKRQIFAQTAHLSPEQKKQIEDQIENMSPEELESFVQQQMESSSKSQKPVFRAIIDGEIPSRKIEENTHAIAVLDIKPISKGHVVIIPKSPSTTPDSLPKQALLLVKKVSKRMSSKLKASNVLALPETKFGEVIINLVPIYDKPLSLTSPRYDASEKELEEIQSKLKAKTKLPRVKISTKPKKSKKVIRINRRVP